MLNCRIQLLEALARLAGENVTSKLVLKKYDDYADKVGAAYMARPNHEGQYVGSWKALAKHTDKMYKQVLTRIGVEFTAEDPYKDFDEMKKDVEETGVLKTFTGASEHSVWSEEENWLFRTVHDAVIHLAGKGHPFTLRGELGAYNRHYKIAPHAARDALFTEIVGQVCTYWYRGEKFDFPQKVCKLWGFDYNKVGVIDEIAYKKNFDNNAPDEEAEEEKPRLAARVLRR